MSALPFPILYEDAEALVIDKPSGLPVDRPRRGGAALEDYLPALRLGFQRLPLAVHRLDQDTSGCLLLARNPKAHKRLGARFAEREVTKTYLGIVSAPITIAAGVISLPLAKISSPERGWRMAVSADGKEAETHWQKLAEHQGRSLIVFRPLTGRTHQLRIHAAAGLGAPLFGDPVYGAGAGAGAGDGAERTMLHAADLAVPRQGKPPITAHAPMPHDFAALGFSEGVLGNMLPWDKATGL